MIVFPNAKINLGLNIIKKRSDGYHNIETVFYPVQLCDVLEVVEDRKKISGKIKFSLSGLYVDGNAKNNLCMKAFDLLNKDFNLPSVKMHLHKIIPTGAGLGGGSSDGAFTLKLLNELFNLKINTATLKNYAQQLGSDCSFFIENTPAFAYGKGENFEKISLSLNEYFILIAKPDVHISTAQAYDMIKPHQPEVALKKIIQMPVNEWKFLLKNDFEKNIFEKFSIVSEIKKKMYIQGATYVSMSGSGSAVYGLFKKKTFNKKDYKNCLIWEYLIN